MPADVQQLIAAVEGARRNIVNAVSGLGEPQASFKPDATTWSIVENVEHLYLAELSGLAKIWLAADSVRAGKMWTEALPNRGRSIEEIVAATWKPKEAAPPIATPHIGGPIAFWIAGLKSITPLLAACGARLGGLDLGTVVFPHFLSGPMDARQRLEFLRFHLERHQEQIARVMQHAEFPGT